MRKKKEKSYGWKTEAYKKRDMSIFNIWNNKNLSYRTLGKMFCLSHERIRQILVKVKRHKRR